MDFSSFTPWTAIAGGVLIGLASALLFASVGQRAGISGIFADTILSRGPITKSSLLNWRVTFLAGLIGGGAILAQLVPAQFAFGGDSLPSTVRIAVAGLLVGAGTRMQNGCTSGHGVCGNAFARPRSIASTITFIAAGALTVFLFRL